MKKQQTAVEWLINEIDMQYPHIDIRWKQWMIQQAKQIEKEQITMAYAADRFPCSDEDTEQYYTETYSK